MQNQLKGLPEEVATRQKFAVSLLPVLLNYSKCRTFKVYHWCSGLPFFGLPG
jgi:hypothetical protein